MTLGKLLTRSEPCFVIDKNGVLTYALAIGTVVGLKSL